MIFKDNILPVAGSLGNHIQDKVRNNAPAERIHKQLIAEIFFAHQKINNDIILPCGRDGMGDIRIDQADALPA